MKKISIISPIYENVGDLSKKIMEFDEFFKDKYDYQIICYYYGQLPGSLVSDSRFVYYRIEEGQGYDDCVADGFSRADGDAVIVADINNEHYLEYIQDLLLEWESRAEVVLTKYQDDKKLNFIQKVGRFFVNLFEKFQNWVLSVAGLTKDYKAVRTFQLFDRNSSDLIKEFPAKNYYLRNFDNWKDYRVAVLKTKEDVKVDRHDKVWTPDLIVSTVSFGISFVMILILAITAGSIASSNRAMYTLIGIGLIIAAFLFGLRNLFFWFIFRKTRIKREKPVKPSVDSSQTGSENDEKKENKTVEKPSNVISRPSKININKPKK